MSDVRALPARRPAYRRLLAGFALSALLVVPVLGHAEGEGSVTIYTRTGGIIQKKISDQAFLDTITKDAMAIPDGGLIMMHGGKWYLVPDHKMADGKTVVDTAMHK